MFRMRGDPGFDARGDLADALLRQAVISGDGLLCLAAQDMSFINAAIAFLWRASPRRAGLRRFSGRLLPLGRWQVFLRVGSGVHVD